MILVYIFVLAIFSSPTHAAPVTEGEFRACVDLAGEVYAAEEEMLRLRAEVDARQEALADASRSERRRLTEEIKTISQQLAPISNTYITGLPRLREECGAIEVSPTTYRAVCGVEENRGNRLCQSFGPMYEELWPE